MVDERTERIYRRVVKMAGRAVGRYRAIAGQPQPAEVSDLLRGLVDEARQRAAEVERAYFLVVGRPALGILPDAEIGGEAAPAASETALLRSTLDEFRRVHVVLREASVQAPPGLPRRTLLDLAQHEQRRITAFTEVYRSRLGATARA